jgi:hypothetical protein
LVDFGGGYLSSDGGGLILRKLERHSGLVRDFADCFVDYRDQRYVEHSVHELVSQRIHGLVLGYEDLNDHDHLRRDPVHGLICGKNDPLGQDRILERDKGKALAAHSTLNRLLLRKYSSTGTTARLQAGCQWWHAGGTAEDRACHSPTFWQQGSDHSFHVIIPKLHNSEGASVTNNTYHHHWSGLAGTPQEFAGTDKCKVATY